VIWVGWRQQRTETLIAAAILLALLVLLLPSGLEMSSTYRHDGVGACLAHPASAACGDTMQSFTDRFEQVGNLIAWLTLVPGVVGILLAAPFVLELEHGTYRLAWTQSITRGRWIATKLGLAVGGGLLAALALTLLVTWWRTPLEHLQGRMDNAVFDSEGIVVFGYTLFALGLAAAVGAVWRRAVPALVVGFAGYFASRLFVDMWLRQRLLAPDTVTWPRESPEPRALAHAWVLTEEPSDRFGHVVHGLLKPCAEVGGHAPAGANCVVMRAAGYMHAVYEPASRFWPLQGIETAIFGGVALLLLAFAGWWTHERAG
jgi:hypothetical protein